MKINSKEHLDEDIRKALINGKDRKTSIKEIINRNALINYTQNRV